MLAAERSTAVLPADSAVAVLTTMATQQSGNTPQLPLPEPQLPLLQPQLPVSQLQLPLPHSQLPAEEEQLLAEECELNDENVDDLPPGEAGPLNKATAEQLNVGCHFMRLGGEGGGRCAISAFSNALARWSASA